MRVDLFERVESTPDASSAPPPPSEPAPPPPPVASATWQGGAVSIHADDSEIRSAVERAFRRTPVALDDASYRQLGTSGEVVVEPGSLEWFRAVALVRVPAETGLETRVVVERIEGGYDPAANYRPFEEQIERLVDRAADDIRSA